MRSTNSMNCPCFLSLFLSQFILAISIAIYIDNITHQSNSKSSQLICSTIITHLLNPNVVNIYQNQICFPFIIQESFYNIGNREMHTYRFSFAKTLLKRINLSLAMYNMGKHPNIWHSIYKWNYDHNLLKNLLKLTNKTLKGLNKYHVFIIDYLYMFIGMALGYVFKECQQLWQQAQNLQIEPGIRRVLIEKVLHNKQIEIKLQQSVRDTVLLNRDIRMNLNYMLMNKVLIPQGDKLNQLVKTGILAALYSQQVYKMVEQETLKGIMNYKQTIAGEAFIFLKSHKMQSIITTEVAPLINSQTVQQIVSKQLKLIVNSQLKNAANQQSMYQLLREKIIF